MGIVKEAVDEDLEKQDEVVEENGEGGMERAGKMVADTEMVAGTETVAESCREPRSVTAETDREEIRVDYLVDSVSGSSLPYRVSARATELMASGDTLEVSLSAEHNTKTTSSEGYARASI